MNHVEDAPHWPPLRLAPFPAPLPDAPRAGAGSADRDHRTGPAATLLHPAIDRPGAAAGAGGSDLDLPGGDPHHRHHPLWPGSLPRDDVRLDHYPRATRHESRFRRAPAKNVATFLQWYTLRRCHHPPQPRPDPVTGTLDRSIARLCFSFADTGRGHHRCAALPAEIIPHLCHPVPGRPRHRLLLPRSDSTTDPDSPPAGRGPRFTGDGNLVGNANSQNSWT